MEKKADSRCYGWKVTQAQRGILSNFPLSPSVILHYVGLEIWTKVKILLRQLQLNKSLQQHQAPADNPQPKAKSICLVTGKSPREDFLLLYINKSEKNLIQAHFRARTAPAFTKRSQGWGEHRASGIHFGNHMDTGHGSAGHHH